MNIEVRINEKNKIFIVLIEFNDPIKSNQEYLDFFVIFNLPKQSPKKRILSSVHRIVH